VHRGRVHQAEADLDRWSSAWRPVLTGAALDDPDTLTRWPAQHPASAPDIRAALDRHARRRAATEHPEDAERLDHAREAGQRYETATNAYYELRSDLERRSHQPLYDTGATDEIPELTQRVAAAQQRVRQADQRTEGLYRDPAITSHPDHTTLLAQAQTAWLHETITASRHATAHTHQPIHSTRHEPYQHIEPDHGRGISR
jgi:uncharacterized protein YecT (DUF1311 family)